MKIVLGIFVLTLLSALGYCYLIYKEEKISWLGDAAILSLDDFESILKKDPRSIKNYSSTRSLLIHTPSLTVIALDSFKSCIIAHCLYHLQFDLELKALKKYEEEEEKSFYERDRLMKEIFAEELENE